MRARPVIADLAGVVVPVLAATIVMLGGAFAVRKYSGPALAASQAATASYQQAMTGRLDLLTKEVAEQAAELEALKSENATLRVQVADLQRQLFELMAENRELRQGSPQRPRPSRA